MATELRALVQIELADDLEGKEIALQNTDFGIHIALVVVVDNRHRVFERDEVGIGFVDDDLGGRVVHGNLPEAGDGHDCENPRYTREDQPFALDEDAEVLAQRRLLRRQHVIKRGAGRLDEFSRLGGLELAHVAISWDVISWNKGAQCHRYSLAAETALRRRGAPKCNTSEPLHNSEPL